MLLLEDFIRKVIVHELSAGDDTENPSTENNTTTLDSTKKTSTQNENNTSAQNENTSMQNTSMQNTSMQNTSMPNAQTTKTTVKSKTTSLIRKLISSEMTSSANHEMLVKLGIFICWKKKLNLSTRFIRRDINYQVKLEFCKPNRGLSQSIKRIK